MYYSKTTGGFYDESIHGARKISVPDPDFVPDDETGDVDPPLIQVDNPACLIPSDAVRITRERYAELLSAQAQGKQIKPDENGAPVAVDPPPPAPPRVVTMRQARLALLSAGLLQAVNSAIEAMTGAAGEAARIEWEYAQTVDRDSELVAHLAAALGLTEQQLDDLFIAASAL